MRGRPAAVGLERGLEPDPDRRHHPRGAPEERDEEEQPERGKRRGDLLDRAADVVLARRGNGQDGQQLVDHVCPDLVVLEHQPEDRHEQDRQRKEREEHVERDRRRVLGRAVAEEALDRERQRDDDPDARCPPARGRGACDPPARLHGWGIAHRLSVRSLLRSDRRRSSENRRRGGLGTRSRGSSTRTCSRSSSWPRSPSTPSCSACRPTTGSRTRWGALLDLLNAACLAVFIVELRVRIALLLAAAVGVLPERLEHLRLRRRRGGVRPGDPPELDVASPRPPAPRRSARARAARPARAPARRLAKRAAARLHRRGDRDDPLRLRHGRMDPVRGRASGAVGEHRDGDADALRDADPRGLPGLHGRGDGRSIRGRGSTSSASSSSPRSSS